MASSSTSPPSSSTPRSWTPEDLSPRDQASFASWRQTLSDFTGLPLVPQTAAQLEHKRLRADEKDWLSCERIKSEILERDEQVSFLLKHLELEGCKTTAASIHCAPCDDTKAGGFSAEHGVLLCQNRMFGKRHMADTLSHELIHLYDHCKFNIDWSNLRHHACTEIRAANLSGDCAWFQEVKRGNFKLKNKQADCVRRRAVLSVMQNPHCPDRQTAEDAVRDVWASCKADTRPFDQIYRL